MRDVIERLEEASVAWDDDGAIHRPMMPDARYADLCSACMELWPCDTAKLQVVWLDTVKLNRRAILDAAPSRAGAGGCCEDAADMARPDG